MIISIIFIIAGFLLKLIAALFSVVNFAIPSQVLLGFETFFSYARIGNGIFPFISDILLSLSTLLYVWIIVYGIKIALWAFAFLPFLGKHNPLPRHQFSETSTTKFNNEGKPIISYKTVQRKRTSR